MHFKSRTRGLAIMLLLTLGILSGALFACTDSTLPSELPDSPSAPPAEETPEPTDPTPAETMTIYVDAANGDDSASGSITAPLKTIPAAQTLARELHRGEAAERTVTVFLREGTYTLTEPLTLAGSDSYTSYAAYEKEAVTVSGGVAVTGWQQLPNSDIWVADAPIAESRDLFVDGVRAVRARSEGAPTVVSFDRKTVTVSDDWLADTEQPRALEFVLKNMWNLPRICAESAMTNNDGTTTFTMVQPGWNTYYETASLGGAALSANQFFYVENAYELLDQPGEWYLDAVSGKIYYIPRAGEDLASAEVILGALEQLICLKGSKALPVTAVSFTGLTFSHTTWMQASSDAGLLTIQANVYKKEGTTQANQWDNSNWVIPASAITGKMTDGVRFEDNVFCALGTAAIHLSTGTKNASILKNELYDCAGSGIVLGGFSHEDHNCINASGSNKDANWHLVSENNVIEDNTIRDIGCVYAGGVGICVGYVRTTSVNYNSLSNLPYTAISLGWGWGFNGTELRDAFYVDEDGNNLFWGNEICHNYIENIMNVLFDGGGIYTLGRNDGALIEGNYICEVNNDYGAIYLDNGSSGFTVTENVIADSYRNYIYKGDRNAIYDNYVTADTAKQPDLAMLESVDPSRPEYTFENNYLWNDDAVTEIFNESGVR